MPRVVPSLALASLTVAYVGALLSAQRPAVPAAQQPPIAFTTDIQPILEKNCLSCHGDGMQMSKFDMRTRESTMSGGAHGSVVVPGNAEQSKLYRMVAGLEKPQMPFTGGTLSAEEVDKIKVWIDLGPAKRGVDPEAYERAAAAAIREALPHTSPFKLDVRAEADPATLP